MLFRCGALPIAQRADDELAAAGMSTPEIARELVVSPRTVETHLSRTYQKLDIAGRDQLPAALSGDAAR
ncbi:MAG: helix-turn-helix domain-containing protein [Mycobacterium sp.]